MKAKSGQELGVRMVMALALATSCVPGVKESPAPPGGPEPGFEQPPKVPSGPPPEFGSPVTSQRPVKPIIGGTLLVLDDARTALASDPDRNRVYVTDYRAEKLVAEFELESNDEPGRLVVDAEGQVHVALRGGGAVLTLVPGPWRIASRRPVCAAPRGLAYDAEQGQIHVACAEGLLVSLPIAPDAPPVRRLQLERDLRDVVVDGNSLLVSKFRSAEVLTIELRQSAKFMKEASNPKFGDLLRMLAGFVSEGQAAGELSADVPAPIVARMIFGILDELALAWLLQRGEKFDIVRAADWVGALVTRGLENRRSTP